MLLLESDHLRWKRGERASYAKHAGKEVWAKGTAYTGGLRMGKMGIPEPGNVPSGPGREEGQGSMWKSQAWLFSGSECCAVHP